VERTAAFPVPVRVPDPVVVPATVAPPTPPTSGGRPSAGTTGGWRERCRNRYRERFAEQPSHRPLTDAEDQGSRTDSSAPGSRTCASGLVDGRHKTRSSKTRQEADRLQTRLRVAARAGELFDRESGKPLSWLVEAERAGVTVVVLDPGVAGTQVATVVGAPGSQWGGVVGGVRPSGGVTACSGTTTRVG
jgi:hypothetical protein